MDLQNPSSNWKKLKSILKQTQPVAPVTPNHDLKRKRSGFVSSTPSRSNHESSYKKQRTTQKMSNGTSSTQKGSSNISELENTQNDTRPHLAASSFKDSVNAGLSPNVEIGRYVALDCEMVGVGPNPDRESALARVSIVNYNGDQIYDSYVKPLEAVTDWRTHVSGIQPKHMIHARNLDQVQRDVASILRDRVLVGHSIRNDLEALLLSHSKRDIRDTARHAPYRRLAGGSSPRLKILASELLGWDIQNGEHSSVEDARACMMLFRRDKIAFEKDHAKKWPVKPVVETNGNVETASAPKKHKKKKKKR